MGSNTLVSKSDGQVISSSDVNQYRTALNQTLVPRNASGVPTDEAGDLGTSSVKFDNAYVKSYSVGDPASGLVIEENGTNQMSFKSSGVERVVIDDDGLDGSGIKAATVGTTELENNAVTTDKLLNDSVTNVKIAANSVDALRLQSNAVTTVKILDANVTEAKIATAAVTPDKRSEDVTRSSGSGAFSTNSTTDVTITNCSGTFSANSRPLRFELLPDGALTSYIQYTWFSGAAGYISLYKGATKIQEYQMSTGPVSGVDVRLPSIAFVTNDITGSDTYTIKARVSSTSASIQVNNMRLVTTLL